MFGRNLAEEFQDVAVAGGLAREASADVREDGFADGAEDDLGSGFARITLEVLSGRFDVEF